MSSLDNVTSIVLSPASVNHSKINTYQNVTIYGGCEQNGIPTPSNPVSIVCNNGVIEGLSSNLFNPITSNIVCGYWLRNSDGTPETSPANYYYNGYMPVKPNTNYIFYGRKKSDNTLSNYNRISWYDSTKTWISNSTYTMGTIGSGVSPANAAFARISCNIDGSVLTTDYVLEWNWMFCEGTQEEPFVPYGVLVNGTQETIKDAYVNEYLVNDNLLGIDSTYRDEQLLVLNTTTPYLQVNRKVGVKLLDGTEDWIKTPQYTNLYEISLKNDSALSGEIMFALISTHFIGTTEVNASMPDNSIKLTTRAVDRTDPLMFIKTSQGNDTLAGFKQWLADQYTAGTPVIVIYPLATTTTETKGDMSAFKATDWWLPISVEGSLSNLQISYSTTAITSSGVFNNKDNITSVNLCNIPWENNSMYNAFCYCDYLLSVSNINDSVTDMTETFSHCYALTTLPVLPSAVTNMGGTFYQCYNLRITDDLIIPSNVTSMILTFYDACRGLTQIRDIIIPNSVTNMKQAFQYFAGTTNASGITARTIDIGTGVTNMNGTFDGCILSATTFRIRSTNVTNATNCFRNTTGYNRPNGTLYVRVPANSTTYDSFVAAGYSTTVAKDEVLLVTY